MSENNQESYVYVAPTNSQEVSPITTSLNIKPYQLEYIYSSRASSDG